MNIDIKRRLLATASPELRDEAVRDHLHSVAREELLDGKLDWINHPEYVVLDLTPANGGKWRCDAEYRGTNYTARYKVNSDTLKVTAIKPWAEAKFKQPPFYGVILTTKHTVDVLLSRESPPPHRIDSYARGGTMYNDASWTDIDGKVEWKRGETQAAFAKRATNVLARRAIEYLDELARSMYDQERETYNKYTWIIEQIIRQLKRIEEK